MITPEEREYALKELLSIEEASDEVSKRVLALMRVILRQEDEGIQPPNYLVILEHDGKRIHLAVMADECVSAVKAAVRKMHMPPCRRPKDRMLPKGYELIRCTSLNEWSKEER